jgi:hypothetical protein
VRVGVANETSERQIPWESSSLKGNFYFVAAEPSLSADAQNRLTEKAIAEAVRKEQQKFAEQLKIATAVPASSLATATNPRFPKVGDEWNYSVTDALSGRSRPVRIAITGVSKEAILQTSQLGNQPRSRAFSSEPELVWNDVLEFAPYLLSFADLTGRESWASIKPQDYASCLIASAVCRISAQAAGKETIKTPAGSFDAVKVVVQMYITGLPGSNRPDQGVGRREMVFWYSEKVKRIVKSTVRTTGTASILDADYDLELTSYRLN